MQTKKKETIKFFSIVFLIILFFFGVIFIANYVSTNLLNPKNSEASADLSSLYSPLLDNSSSRITQRYDINEGGLHWGIDIGWVSSQANPKDIYAAGSGVVTDDSSTKRYCPNDCGNYVTIKHNSNLFTRYQHLANEYVSVGQTVDQNTKIGLMGSTGISRGDHLHFEITTKEFVFQSTNTSLFLNPTSVYLHRRSSTPSYTNPPQNNVSCGSNGCSTDADCDGYDNNKPGTTTCNERTDGDASKQTCSRICTYGYVNGNICTCASSPTTAPTTAPTSVPTSVPTAVPTTIPTTAPTPIVLAECKKMDINGDTVLNYIDLQSFTSIYNKTCSNNTTNIDPTGCKGQDSNKDGKIDYKDLAALVKNYSPRVSSCVGMPGL